jgi:hypothetical protein
VSKIVSILVLILLYILVNVHAVTISIIISYATPYWTTGETMPNPIFEFSATVLNGKIYVAGETIRMESSRAFYLYMTLR